MGHFEKRDKAYVPLIRIGINDFLFDFLFVNVSQQYWANMMKDPLPRIYSLGSLFFDCEKRSNLLTGLDAPSFRSIQFIFTVSSLLDFIPQASWKVWNFFIRFINAWTRKRRICSNLTCFPSSLTYVLMATYIFFVCPEEKQGDLVELIRRFFDTFSRWRWDQKGLRLQQNGVMKFNL